MKDVIHIFQLIFTAIGGYIGWFLGGFDGLVYALVAFVIIDYLTGLMAAVFEKRLSSDIGFKGIFKKVLIFTLVGIGHIIDFQIIKNGSAVRTAVIFFYLSNEGLSIVENATRIGLPVPEKLKRYLQSLRKGMEKVARICIDPGHGGKDPGAIYKGRKESDDNLALGRAVAAELRKHKVVVDETRTVDKAVSLRDRSNFENRGNYDYFVSFHRNAFKPEQAKGVETYVYINTGVKARELANKIQAALAGVGFTNRGVKAANFHVLRETKAPAVLVEVGFVDNSADNQLFDAKRSQIIKAVAEAILSQLGVKYSPAAPPPPKQQSSQTLYRVMAGSFRERQNAEKQVERLKEAGFDAAIMIFKP